MINRNALAIGARVRLPDDREGTVVPTGRRVPETEVNVMLDHTGRVGSFIVKTLDLTFSPPE